MDLHGMSNELWRGFLKRLVYVQHSLCLPTAKQGEWNSVTESILLRIARHFREQPDVDFIALGGDFNYKPPEIAQCSVLGMMDAEMVAPQTRKGTIRTNRSNSNLDYSIVSEAMTKLLNAIETVERTGVKGHVPVHLHFMAQAAAGRGLKVRLPPPLPRERVVGPIPTPFNMSTLVGGSKRQPSTPAQVAEATCDVAWTKHTRCGLTELNGRLPNALELSCPNGDFAGGNPP